MTDGGAPLCQAEPSRRSRRPVRDMSLRTELCRWTDRSPSSWLFPLDSLFRSFWFSPTRRVQSIVFNSRASACRGRSADPSGTRELPRPPQPIPIHQPLPRLPIPSLRPPWPIPMQRRLPRPDHILKATAAYPNSSATSQARNTPLTPGPKPSYEPFEPHRDQVRRDGINPFTSETHVPYGPCLNNRLPNVDRNSK